MFNVLRIVWLLIVIVKMNKEIIKIISGISDGVI